MTREEAIALRLSNQCLVGSPFEKPEEIVDWMGMMQAQDYMQFRWAIGMRMKEPKMTAVKDSFSSGKMLRLHLLRCTVQVTTPKDYPWLLNLCQERNLRTIQSWPSYNSTAHSELYHQEGTEALKAILSSNKSLTKKDISEEMAKFGLPSDTAHLNQILLRGEVEGLLCSGEMNGKEATWTLVTDELKNNSISTSQALPLLARKYFRSHSPASFEDFCWWTGLTITQNRQAIQAIASELEEVKVGEQEMYVYHPLPISIEKDDANDINLPKESICQNTIHLLPPYDECLIGYKSRWVSLDKKHEAKAHNRSGIFKPVILYQGKVVGNWKASLLHGAEAIETDIFAKKREMGVKRLEKAKKALQIFCQ